MISSNIVDSKLPLDQKLTDYIKKSTTVTVNGKKIGIIGYVTTKTAVSIPICFQGRDVKLDRLVACKIRKITLIDMEKQISALFDHSPLCQFKNTIIQDIDFWPKIYQILYLSLENLTTHTTKPLYSIHTTVKSQVLIRFI